MTKIILDTIATGYQSLQTVNANNTTIVNAIDNTVSRDGTAPNYMQADFDMNSHRILNLPTPVSPNEPARLADIASTAVLTAISLINITVDTIAALKAYTMSAALVGQLVYVRGYTAIGDGGEGFFRITASNPGTDNAGTLIWSNTANYYFIRQLSRQYVTPEMFGAKADGSTNDATAITNALAASKLVILNPKTYLWNGSITMSSDSALVGSGPSSKVSGDNTVKVIIDSNNVRLADFSFVGLGNHVIQVGKNSAVSNIIIERVHFTPTVVNGQNNCVSLYDFTNVRIQNCNFVSVLYGVIHELATTVGGNNLKVLNCYFSDMYGDAVLLNAGNGPQSSVDSLIDGCSFMGSHAGATTEKRFVGVTCINSLTISNNFVQANVGDAAIHLEATGGRVTIHSNKFIDCGASAGNTGFIYILNSGKTVIITNNWFVRTSASAGTSFVDCSSGAYSNEMIITGNNFKDTSGHAVIALNLTGHTGQSIIANNYGFGLDQFVQLASASAVQVLSNTLESTNYGVYSTGAGVTDVDIKNNTFACSTYSVRLPGPLRIHVTGNHFLTGDVLGTGATDCFMSGNMFGSTLANYTMASAGPTRVVEAGLNFKNGTGAV